MIIQAYPNSVMRLLSTFLNASLPTSMSQMRKLERDQMKSDTHLVQKKPSAVHLCQRMLSGESLQIASTSCGVPARDAS